MTEVHSFGASELRVKNLFRPLFPTFFSCIGVYNEFITNKKTDDLGKEIAMEEEIYADVLFIINFSMDFLSLYIVGRLMHFKMEARRVIFGASVGALYGVPGVGL